MIRVKAVVKLAGLWGRQRGPRLNSLDRITQYFDDIEFWCIVNTEKDSFDISKMAAIHDTNTDTMIFTKEITFINDEDATAFKFIFTEHNEF